LIEAAYQRDVAEARVKAARVAAAVALAPNGRGSAGGYGSAGDDGEGFPF
jgi:hypothetical protein